MWLGYKKFINHLGFSEVYVDKDADKGLKRELDGLLRYLNRVKSEIAAIGRPADEEHGFESMGEQLDAIVKATAEATDTIMDAVEKNEDLTEKIRAKTNDPELLAYLDEMNKNSGDVFEACSFQDITGQRVSKVVKSITYVEERVNTLVEFWGSEELEMVDVEKISKTEDEKLLNGPQLSGKGLSQDDIDSLFD